MRTSQVVQRKKNLSLRRITEGHGSVSMQNLLETRKAQEQEREDEEAAKTRPVDEREEKKAADAKAKEELVAKFKACLPFCTCAPAPTEPPADESPETNDENTPDVSHLKAGRCGRKRKRPNKDMPQPMFEKPAPPQLLLLHRRRRRRTNARWPPITFAFARTAVTEKGQVPRS